jgi:hypothetical protein
MSVQDDFLAILRGGTGSIGIADSGRAPPSGEEGRLGGGCADGGRAHGERASDQQAAMNGRRQYAGTGGERGARARPTALDALAAKRNQGALTGVAAREQQACEQCCRE